MNLRQIRFVLLAALHQCERQRPDSDPEPPAASSSEGARVLLERLRSTNAFWAACSGVLESMGVADFKAFFESVVHHRGDTVVRSMAAEIESALGRNSGMVFGIVDDPPIAVSLQMAQLIVARIQRQLAVIERRGKQGRLMDFEEKWLLVFQALKSESSAFGFGVGESSVWCMLGACLRHRGDREIDRWCQRFEAVLGLPAPDSSLEQARPRLEQMSLAKSTAAFHRERDELFANESQDFESFRKLLALEVKTEAPLLRQYGFEPTAQGLIQCCYKDCIHWGQLRAEAAKPAHLQLTEGSVDGAVEDLSSRIDVLESLVHAKDKYIAQLVAKLADDERDHKAIWAQVSIRDKDISELTSQLVQKEAAVAKLQADVLAKSESISKLSDRIAEYSCEMELVREEVISAQKLVTDLAGDCSWLPLDPPIAQQSLWESRDHEEAELLRERLLEHMQSADMWRAEALEMSSHNAQLEAELQEICSLSRCAQRCFGLEEELDWEGSPDHRRSELEKGSYGWSQINARFCNESQHQIASIEVLRSRWLELGCQSRLRQCGLAIDSFPATDAAKRQAVDRLLEQRVFGGPSNLFWAWHACDPRSVDGFVRSGFIGTTATESGTFGNGYHLRLESEYACKLAMGFPACDGQWCIVLVLVALAGVRPLSWCSDDFQMRDVSDPADCKYFGQRLQKGGAHVVPLQWQGSACGIARGMADCHDLIVDDHAQVLPFATCWFR